MKRAAVKRKKASPGGKRNAPRRRSPVNATVSKTRSKAPKRKVRTKTKTAASRNIATKRKTLVRRSIRRTANPARAAVSASVESKLTLKVSSEGDKVRTIKAARLEGNQSTKRKPAVHQSEVEIPPILFEGDEPEPPSHSGPGEKFSLGPETPAAHFATAETHLPAGYGTGRLFLAARDPHWIYAYWDINSAEQFQHNARSQDRHLILRMHERDLGSKPAAEIHVHPESRHWFAHVERAGEQYVADLGYYHSGRKWKSLATSRSVRTPPDSISTEAKVEFATIPAEVPFETMLSLVQEDDEQELPLAHAIEQLRDRRLRDFSPTPPPTAWTSEQERALAEIVSSGKAQKALLGSQEITGLPIEGLTADFSAFGMPSSLEYVSSPLGGQQTSPEFWFKINAELTIYGSTEPNAKVLAGGKEIPLQPDGSFSFRFALPDGEYEVPIVAVSADSTDARAAELTFSRATKLSGDVGQQPQDPALKPPRPDAI